MSSSAKLTNEQRAIIRAGALNGIDWESVHGEVDQIKPVTQKLVKKLMEEFAAERSVKSEAKKEGSRIVREFLEKAKNGVDVDDMEAALEQAVYWDILRRYAQAGDAFVSMTMEQILKLEISYRAARLARHKKETGIKKNKEISKLSAIVCQDALDKIISMVDGKVRVKIKKLEKPLLEWAANEYGKENIAEIINEKNEIERLASLIGKRRSGVNSVKTPQERAIAGLAG